MSARRTRPARFSRAAVRSYGRGRAGLLLTVAAGAAVLSACGPGAPEGSADRRPDFVQDKDGIATVPVAQRRPAPDLSGTTTRGKPLDLADYKGKVVVVNIWSSTCGPCIAETPNLVRVAESTRGEGVRFVGINTRDPDTPQAVGFEERHKVPYPSLSDPSGKLLLRFPKNSINPQLIPATVVLDRQGRPAARTLGPVSEDVLRKMIDPLLKEK